MHEIDYNIMCSSNICSITPLVHILSSQLLEVCELFFITVYRVEFSGLALSQMVQINFGIRLG